MPRQARKPCSGCGLARMMASHSAAVDGPIFRRQPAVAPASSWRTAMRARHVLGHRGVPPRECDRMRRDTQAAMEHLDGLLGDARLDHLADQPGGHRVEMAVHLDVVVGSDPGAPPLGVW